MTNEDRNAVIEQCASIIDQCNREGPYQAIAAAKRIRALKDFTPEPYCMQQALNQTCSRNPGKCDVCGFEPDNNLSVIPCHRGGHSCRWPACPSDCDGRPGSTLTSGQR